MLESFVLLPRFEFNWYAPREGGRKILYSAVVIPYGTRPIAGGMDVNRLSYKNRHSHRSRQYWTGSLRLKQIANLMQSIVLLEVA
jgi:hypothetical protein